MHRAPFFIEFVCRGLSAAQRYISTHVDDIAVFLVCMLLYYIVIARRYFGADVIGGDTQIVWSMDYFTMESLIEYLQYPLWDPTSLGGYPFHLIMVNGWFQNFHPFQLPFLLIAAAIGRAVHIDSNYLVVFHKTIYLFSLNLVVVILITREIERLWGLTFSQTYSGPSPSSSMNSAIGRDTRARTSLYSHSSA
jgi:hypothetical protein